MAAALDDLQALRRDEALEVVERDERVAVAGDDEEPAGERSQHFGRIRPLPHRLRRAHQVVDALLERDRACPVDDLAGSAGREELAVQALPERLDAAGP